MLKIGIFVSKIWEVCWLVSFREAMQCVHTIPCDYAVSSVLIPGDRYLVLGSKVKIRVSSQASSFLLLFHALECFFFNRMENWNSLMWWKECGMSPFKRTPARCGGFVFWMAQRCDKHHREWFFFFFFSNLKKKFFLEKHHFGRRRQGSEILASRFRLSRLRRVCVTLITYCIISLCWVTLAPPP